jgi:hypothetical protein
VTRAAATTAPAVNRGLHEAELCRRCGRVGEVVADKSGGVAGNDTAGGDLPLQRDRHLLIVVDVDQQPCELAAGQAAGRRPIRGSDLRAPTATNA